MMRKLKDISFDTVLVFNTLFFRNLKKEKEELFPGWALWKDTHKYAAVIKDKATVSHAHSKQAY